MSAPTQPEQPRPRNIRVRALLVVLAFVPILSFGLMSWFSKRPAGLGAAEGRLADCPSSPNCVCSQATRADQRIEPLTFTGDPSAALQRLQQAVASLPRTRVVTVGENYLHAESTSLIFRFVDDVEFLIDAEQGTIECRSASRTGHSDFGVNRKRIERIRKAFDKLETKSE